MKLEPNQELYSNCCHGIISSSWPESDFCPECHDHCGAIKVTYDNMIMSLNKKRS